MNTDIEKLREIYVAEDVDVETRTDNLAVIAEWEKRLRELEGFSRWQGHEVTQEILAKAKKAYIDHSLLLASSRDLTDTARQSLWAKQDAVMWLISIISEDAKGEIANINALVARALI
jgi:hypothetical protein